MAVAPNAVSAVIDFNSIIFFKLTTRSVQCLHTDMNLVLWNWKSSDFNFQNASEWSGLCNVRYGYGHQVTGRLYMLSSTTLEAKNSWCMRSICLGRYSHHGWCHIDLEPWNVFPCNVPPGTDCITYLDILEASLHGVPYFLEETILRSPPL